MSQPSPAPAALVIGCGHVGSHVATALQRLGFAVTGTTRSESRVAELTATGIDAEILDLASASASPAWRREYTSAIYCVSPGRGGDGRLGFLDGALRCAEQFGESPERFVYVSSTGVHGQRDGSWLDETSPTSPSTDNQRLILEAERRLLDESGVPAIVVRLGGLYGPGRSPLDWIRRDEFRARLTGSPDAWMNWIHVDDAVESITAAATRGGPGETYLAVDGNPVRRGDFWGLAARLAGVEPPELVATDDDLGKRFSNRKLVEKLEVELRFPDYRAGLNALL